MLIECAEEFTAKQQECSTLAKSLEMSENTLAKQVCSNTFFFSQISVNYGICFVISVLKVKRKKEKRKIANIKRDRKVILMI